ncbi:MAG: hypothetical protein V3S49_04925 [Thermodesulfobacteriota bacterium]
MEQNIDEMKINGIEYVRKDSIQNTKAIQVNNLDYVIARTTSAGVFAGYLSVLSGQEATIFNARRIWYWDGAASLSQLAVEGTSKPNNCKFPCEVEKVVLTSVIEILTCTEKGRISILEVPIWKM